MRKPGDEFGTRTETKNVNSVRFVMQVIEYEANRQVDVLESGGSVDQETRLFDVATGTTRTMRSKEDAHDYRYFPDPDLLPLVLEDDFLEDCRASLPELPDAKRVRYETELGLTPYNARELTAEVETFARFEGSDRIKHGTGLGLAIVKGFAEAMGLTVSAANNADPRGACFTITVPQNLILSAPTAEDIA